MFVQGAGNGCGASRRYSSPRIGRAAGREDEMEKVIQCPCGTVIKGENDDAVVTRAQQHAKEVHNMDLTREQALSMAKPA